MERLQKKRQNLLQRKRKIRSKIQGTAQRPRLSINVSSKHISAQLIDDENQHTIAAATTVGQDKKLTGNLSEKAAVIGTDIAKKAKKAKIKQIVFDRNGRLYHGRIKALAEAARAEGLEF